MPCFSGDSRGRLHSCDAVPAILRWAPCIDLMCYICSTFSRATETCAGQGQDVKLRPMCSTCRVLGPIATLVLSDLKRKLYVLPSESVANGNVDITLLFDGQYRSFLSCATAGLSAQPACTFLTKRGSTCAKTISITPSRPPIS